MTVKKFWNLTTPEEAEAPAEMLMYGEISNETWFGDEITPKCFADDINSLEGRNINLHINSPGGDVFAAQAIYSQLMAYAGTVNVFIDGMCASAATIVAMAGDNVTMPDNAIFMIHNPMVGVCGMLNEQELSKMQDSLRAIKQTIVNVYMKRCKNATEIQIKNMMNAETWMTAEQAFNYGFVDVVDKCAKAEGAEFTNCIDYAKAKYKNFGMLSKAREVEKMSMDNQSFFDKIRDMLSVKDSNSSVEEAVKAERARIMALNAMNDGSEIVAKMVNVAIENGNTAEEIKEYVDSVKAIQPKETPQDKGISMIKDIIKDQMNSGAENVDVVPSQSPEAQKEQEEAQEIAKNVDMVANAMAMFLK